MKSSILYFGSGSYNLTLNVCVPTSVYAVGVIVIFEVVWVKVKGFPEISVTLTSYPPSVSVNAGIKTSFVPNICIVTVG